MSVTGEDTRERIIALERDFVHLSKRFDETARQVAEMHELLLKAKGARWMLVALAGMGGFAGGKLSAFVPFLNSLPR